MGTMATSITSIVGAWMNQMSPRSLSVTTTVSPRIATDRGLSPTEISLSLLFVFVSKTVTLPLSGLTVHTRLSASS